MVNGAVFRFSKPFDVSIRHDRQENVWIAECDELGLVTEANTCEELKERVWALAPELYEMNGLGQHPEHIRLSFTQIQSRSDRIAL